MTTKRTVPIDYALPGDCDYQARLYPPVGVVQPGKGSPIYHDPPKTTAEIIEHFCKSSLDTDGIPFQAGTLKAYQDERGLWRIRFDVAPNIADNARQFEAMHQMQMDEDHAGQAMNGVDALKRTPGAWNPMAGFPVNRNSADGDCKWHLFLPLGMPMVNQKAVTLLHYPPYEAMQNLDYLHNMTLERWQRLLKAVGLPENEYSLYNTIVDVNPIAAPGSGQSEYNNDYFPVMMASSFFDAPSAGRGYIRSMLEALLNPPHNDKNPYTLPLLVGGSPLYDPQAPAWFRVRFKDQMPKPDGIPQADVLQAGFVRLHAASEKKTPYMIANHMIAAGVTGTCTEDAGKIPDIRKYEAQDLVAAEFLRAYQKDPGLAPATAKKEACQKWFGDDDGSGAPNPRDDARKKLICILAQMDLFFVATPTPHPKYTWEQATRRCEELTGGTYNPCCTDCAPPKRHII
jgi:hypothetical protein